jgi:iron complex outermembrane receptor protein
MYAALTIALLLICGGGTRAWAQADAIGETRGDASESVGVEAEAAADATPASTPAGVEVIRVKGKTVTAMETEVPSSVTQFDPATIAALGAQNISDLAKVTPNVEIRSSGATTATFFIRGVGLSDFNANAAGAVAIYQDGVAMNSPALQLGQLFDLADVQVLRGPQGSGPGRNASAGAIRVVSRKPTGEWSAALRADLSNTSEDPRTGALFAGRDFEGALQIPLADELLSSRFAFRFSEKDPFRKNGCSTKYVPTQAERDADPAAWDRTPVCGINTFPNSFPNPNPPPNRFRITNVDPIKQNKVNDTGNWAGRGQLRFTPPDFGDTRVDLLLNFHGGQVDQQSTLGQAIGTGQGYGGFTFGGYRDPDIVEMENRLIDQGLSTVEAREEVGRELARNLDIRPYRGDYNRVGQTELDTWGGFLRADVEIGDSVDLASITAFDNYDRNRDTDQDNTPLELFEALIEDDGWQFTQDLQLTGEVEEQAFRWSLGGFYLQEVLNSNNEQIFLRGGNTRAISVYEQKTWSFGVYAGFEWDFLEDFTLEAGGRYNWEQKDFDFNLTRGPNSRSQIDSKIWSAPTGTLSLTYRFTPEISAYSKLSRGWKGGHFNGSANLLEAIEPADPETITAFESGFRARAFDGRLDLSGAFFYYRYEDYQVFLFENNLGSPPLLQIVNADDAENYGAELNIVARPLEDLVPDLFAGLRVEMTIGWLRSEFLDFTQTRTAFIKLAIPVQETIDYSGNPLINSPEWKVVLNASWAFDFGRYGSLTPRYDGVWTDDIFFDPTEGRGIPDANGDLLPEYAVGQRAHWLHNLRLAYQAPGGHMELAAFVRNLEDKVVKTYAFDASRFSSLVVNFVGEPRTYGFSLSYKF